MGTIVHRHLGKVVAGAAMAVAGTAVMVPITLPNTAGAVHWQGFAIAPRDVTAMNPLTPSELRWQNGHRTQRS